MSVSHASPEIDGAKLRERRKLAGLSVSDAALKMGISITYLSAIERGHRRTVAPATYVRICDALDVKDRSELLKAAA